jgi:hypothetical protein
MVMHATSYDVLVKGVVLYPLGVTIDFWEEITYYCLGWQIRTSHKASLLVRFIGGQARKSNKSTKLVGFLSLLHGLELLEGNINYQDAPQNDELAMSRLKAMLIIPLYPLDPMPPWGTLNEFQALTSHYIH